MPFRRNRIRPIWEKMLSYSMDYTGEKEKRKRGRRGD